MTKSKTKTNKEVVMAPLGGVGEIGMNCMLYGYGEAGAYDWIMIDLGLTFVSPREPGIGVIVPDITFAEQQGANLKAIILTHAHEDHYGAIPDLWDNLQVPIYATPFTAAMLRAKLAREGLEDEVPIHELPVSSKTELGPFTIELVNMSHSIPEPMGVHIKTEAGTIFHTGDWKLDPTPLVGAPTDENRLRELGNEGIDVLVCDSTNAPRDGTSISEADVAKTLKAAVKKAKRRVLVTTFASNVARIKSIAEAGYEAGRYVILAGRALTRVVAIAKETGYIPEDYTFMSDEDFQHLPPKECLVIATGSQGEGRAAMARIAEGSHPKIKPTKGDTVIFSSRTIPGNEKSVSYVINKLAGQDLELITESEAPVHVTGHPRRGELELLYQWLKPKCLIPVHGEERHLQAHKTFAEAQGISNTLLVRNGHMAAIAPEEPSLIAAVPAGRHYRDGYYILEDERAIKDRRKLANVGCLSVSLVISTQGKMLTDPLWAAEGLPFENDSQELESLIKTALNSVLKSIPPKHRKDPSKLQETIRRSVRGAIYNNWGKKTLVKIHLHQLAAKGH